uniref:Uncharacterized protein n=1 Tax=Gopherus agassizii TaxID=38772 RepID=A0A452J7F6_9SAUR
MSLQYSVLSRKLPGKLRCGLASVKPILPSQSWDRTQESWPLALPPAPHYTHLLCLFGGEEAGLPASREVAVHLEGVPGAALVGVDPVLAWGWGGSVHKESSSPDCPDRAPCCPLAPPSAAQPLAPPWGNGEP